MGFFIDTQIERLAKMSKMRIAAVIVTLGITFTGCADINKDGVLTDRPDKVQGIGYCVQFVNDGSYPIFKDGKIMVFQGIDAKDAEKKADNAAKEIYNRTKERVRVVPLKEVSL